MQAVYSICSSEEEEQFVEILALNIGFTLGKHFIIPGKTQTYVDHKTTFEDTIHCWIIGEKIAL